MWPDGSILFENFLSSKKDLVLRGPLMAFLLSTEVGHRGSLKIGFEMPCFKLKLFSKVLNLQIL